MATWPNFSNFPSLTRTKTTAPSRFADLARQQRILDLQAHIGATNSPSPGATTSAPPKLVLNNELQNHSLPPAVYQTRRVGGPDHAPIFVCGLLVCGHFECGTGSSVLAAEHAAAAAMLSWASSGHEVAPQLNGAHGEYTGTDDTAWNMTEKSFTFTLIKTVTDDNSATASGLLESADGKVPANWASSNLNSGIAVSLSVQALGGVYPPSVAVDGSVEVQLSPDAGVNWYIIATLPSGGILKDDFASFLCPADGANWSFVAGADLPLVRCFYTGVDAFAAYDLILTMLVERRSVLTTYPVHSVTDVNVVGFSAQDAAVWVTDSRPNVPVVVPPPARADRADAPGSRLAATNGGASLAAQTQRNRRMHSANGNTAICYDGVLSEMLDDMEAPVPTHLHPQRVVECDASSDRKLAELLGPLPDWYRATTSVSEVAPVLFEMPKPPQRVGKNVHKNTFAGLKAEQVPEAIQTLLPQPSNAGAAVRYVLSDTPLDPLNYFGVLAFDGFLDVDDCDVVVPPAGDMKKTSVVGQKRLTTSDPAGKSPPAKTGVPREKSETPRDRRNQNARLDPNERRLRREAGVTRVCRKILTQGEDSVVRWFLECTPSTSFAYDVCTQLWGKAWLATDSWPKWFMSWRLCSSATSQTPGSAPRALEMMGHFRLQAPLKQLSGVPAVQEWFDSVFIDTWVSTEAVFGAEADAHNAAMHSLNGNGIFAGDMDEVRAAPAGSTLYSTPVSSETPKPWVTATEVSTVMSSVNPVDTDVPTAMPLRGDVVTAANAVVDNRQLPGNESFGAPRRVRDGAAAGLINSTNRVALAVFGPMSYSASKLEDSDLMKSIIEAAIRANQNLGRADNVTLGGFQAFDVAFIGRIKSYFGLSMQTALMKLTALSLILNMSQNRRNLPLSMEAGLYDPYTQLDPVGPVVTGYNGSTIFGEGCGGATAVLPFRGGDAGEVFFHQTLETVPEPERATALFLPANLLLADYTPGQAIFLFVSMWADWPTLMWEYILPTLDTAAGNGADQRFIPHLATTFIPGLTRMHIILPRRTTVRNPTTQGEANTNALVQPVTGPVASNGLAADTPLDVNYVGGGLNGYNMAEFCYTWGQGCDATDIAQFIQRLNDLVDIRDELAHCFEKLAPAGVRYPPLVCQALDGVDKLAVNSAAGFQQISSLGVTLAPSTQNFPLASIPRPDFLCFETDIIAWNKAVLTVAVVSGRPPSGEPVTALMANPQSAYWFKLLARHQATTTTVHVAQLGWPAATWDAAYANADMRSFRLLARAHYAGAASGSLSPQPAQLGPSLARLFTALLGFSPSRDLVGNTVFDYMAAPRTTRCTVISTAGVALTNCCPVILPDVWVYQTAKCVPRGLMSYPPQNNEKSTTGLVAADYAAIIAAGAAYYGPMLRTSSWRNALKQTDTRDDTDEEIWNARLVVVLAAGAIMRDAASGVVANSPAAGQAPKAAILTADYTVPNLTTGLRSASTFWIPRVLPDGRLQYPMADRASMISLGRIQVGIQRAAIEIWAINGLLPSGDLKLGLDAPGSSMWLDMLRAAPVDLSQGGAQPEPQTPAAGSGGAPPSTST